MTPLDFQPRTRLVQGPGRLPECGRLARELGLRRVLIVAGHGMEHAGYTQTVLHALAGEGIESTPWSGFDANPDARMVEHGRDFAAKLRIDGIVALGGGSALDTAKGINLVLTNGGAAGDYRGTGRINRPLLPMIGIPATTGTGTEARSGAVITDPATREKMLCGEGEAAFHVAVLDPSITGTQPPRVRAAAGYAAIAHAVESFVSRESNALSDAAARQAWRLLEGAYERDGPIPSAGALADLQWGAWFAGTAVELAGTGAAEACADPLTARYALPHGLAVAALLTPVVRWNTRPEYTQLHPDLPARLDDLARAGGFETRLRALGVAEPDLPALAEAAARHRSAPRNPRPLDAEAALAIYRAAY